MSRSLLFSRAPYVTFSRGSKQFHDNPSSYHPLEGEESYRRSGAVQVCEIDESSSPLIDRRSFLAPISGADAFEAAACGKLLRIAARLLETKVLTSLHVWKDAHAPSAGLYGRRHAVSAAMHVVHCSGTFVPYCTHVTSILLCAWAISQKVY